MALNQLIVNGIEDFEKSKMDKVIYPPNKLLEPKMNYSSEPVVYDHLMFLDFNEKGNCILGCSDINGTFWEGTLLYFNDAEKLQALEHSEHYIYSTHSDGKFVNDSTVALAANTGHIDVISVNSPVTSVNYFTLGDRVSQIDVWKHSNRIVACAGKSVSVWESDNKERKPLHLFGDYHLDVVNCVEALKTDTNCFLSGSRDRNVCIWDIRNPVAASVLYANEFASITALAWNQDDDNYVVMGTQGGDIYLVDRREPKHFVTVYHCFEAPVNRISFKESKELAVCGDTEEVLILENDNNMFTVVYSDTTQHKGHVKGMRWHNGDLYTCGFGRSIAKHKRSK